MCTGEHARNEICVGNFFSLKFLSFLSQLTHLPQDQKNHESFFEITKSIYESFTPNIKSEKDLKSKNVNSIINNLFCVVHLVRVLKKDDIDNPYQQEILYFLQLGFKKFDSFLIRIQEFKDSFDKTQWKEIQQKLLTEFKSILPYSGDRLLKDMSYIIGNKNNQKGISLMISILKYQVKLFPEVSSQDLTFLKTVSTTSLIEDIIQYPSTLTINEVVEFLMEVDMKFDYWIKKDLLKHSLMKSTSSFDVEFQQMISKIVFQSNLFVSYLEASAWIDQLNSDNIFYFTDLIKQCNEKLSTISSSEFIYFEQKPLTGPLFAFALKNISHNTDNKVLIYLRKVLNTLLYKSCHIALSDSEEEKLNLFYEKLAFLKFESGLKKESINAANSPLKLWDLISKYICTEVYPLFDVIYEKCKKFHNYKPMLHYLSMNSMNSIFNTQRFP
jgi:hypothetical protein